MASQSRASSAPKSQKPASTDVIERTGQELIESFKLIEEAWAKAEAKLALAHVPVDVKIKVEDGDFGDDSPGEGYASFLGFVKQKSSWRICFITITTTYPMGDERREYDCRPITECPVETRLEMFERFPELYEEVLKVAKSYVPKIKESVAKFEQTLLLLDL